MAFQGSTVYLGFAIVVFLIITSYRSTSAEVRVVMFQISTLYKQLIQMLLFIVILGKMESKNTDTTPR